MKRQKVIAAFWVWALVLTELSPVWAKVLEVPGQFKSITAALETATPGDEIIVAPGTYEENLVLKKGVVLRSQGSQEERSNFASASRTIIQSPGVEQQIVLGADDAVLDGFTLKSKNQTDRKKERYGVLIDGTATTIKNCIIAFLPYTGIEIKGSTKNTKIIIKNNKIYENRGDGISCEEMAEVHIDACEIYLNGGSGVHNASQAPVTIKHNIIRENDVDGVMNSGRAKPFILENEIYQNGLNGVGLQLMSKGRVVSNKIKGNQQAGIGLRMKAECIILNNTISENTIGIGLLDIKQAIIESNTITGNYMVGIGMIRCQGGEVILRKNDLRGNRMFPISPNLACELTDEDNQK
jgi:parallel beta-helix repeat protein